MREPRRNRATQVAAASFLLIASGPAMAAGEGEADSVGALLLRVDSPGAAPTGPGERFRQMLLEGYTVAAIQPGDARRTAAAPASPPPGTATRAPFLAVAPDPATLLLLMVQLDDLTLTDGLAAYGAPDDPLLPIGELSRLLELDIDVSPAQGRVTGSLGEARRALLVDLATATARLGAAEQKLGPEDVALTQTEIYVRASVLEKLLPLKFMVSASALTMKVLPLELLPIQGRLQRLQRAQQATTDPNANKALRVADPYHLFTPPSFDIALGLGAQTARPQRPLRYDIRMGGDLAYAGLQAYVGSDESGRATTARVLLERRSLDGHLLGPLHATSIGLGDVFTPNLAIGPRSFAGRGVALSTVPLDQTYVFNRIDLRGELPLGDDVELYVNDVLRGTQNTPQQGRYEFLNVPLTQGVNVVRIVTYGPRGQRSEEVRVINVSGGLLRAGQATFEFGAVQQDDPLFPLRSQGPVLFDRGTGKPRVVASFNYGVSQYLTLTAGASRYSDRQGIERSLFDTGLRSSIAGFATQFDLAADDQHGRGASLGIAGRVLGANAIFRHSEYQGGLLDENNPEADVDRPLDRRSELTVDQNVRLGERVIPLSFRVIRDAYADRGVTTIGSARGSAALGSILYSTGLEYERSTRPGRDGGDDHLRGYFAGSTFKNFRWQVRATLNYDIVPDYRVTLFNVTVDRAITDTWSLRFAANQRLDFPRGTELALGSVTRTRYGDLALTGEYDTANDSWRLAAQMNFGLGFNPQTRGYEFTRSGPGSGGSVLFHAFSDTNGDGVYQPGERPVENVILEGGERVSRTAKDGTAYLSGFGATPTARVLVGLSEIDNPSVKAPPAAVEFAPRPGGVTRIEYPLRPTGEVLVNISLRRPDGKLVGLSATRVRLVDDKGLALEATTEFDGSASFLEAPAGVYRLELDAEQAARLRMRLAAPATVVIRADGEATPDIRAEVVFDPRNEPATSPPG